MPKRSRIRQDMNEAAAPIVREATEEEKPAAAAKAEEPALPVEERKRIAALLGRAGGLKGGRARAEKLSAEARSESARKAAQARWRR
jgi:hypothetical protein